MTKHKSSSQPFVNSFFNARLTSLFSVSLVLFLLGLLTMNFMLANRLSAFVKENISFSIMIKDDAKENEVQQLEKRMKRYPFVKSMEYISKDKALEFLIEELGDDPKEFLGYNPLYASMEVYLKSDYANRDSIAKIEKLVKAQSGIRDVSFRKDLIDLVNDNLNKVGVVLLILSAILTLISFALISNTIRLSIYAKRFLINTMKLVGATPSFIRKPFVVSSILNGLVSSLLSLVMLYGLVYYLTLQIDNFVTVLRPEDLVIVAVAVVVSGVLLSALSARMAVNRYLKMKTDHLYYV